MSPAAVLITVPFCHSRPYQGPLTVTVLPSVEITSCMTILLHVPITNILIGLWELKVPVTVIRVSNISNFTKAWCLHVCEIFFNKKVTWHSLTQTTSAIFIASLYLWQWYLWFLWYLVMAAIQDDWQHKFLQCSLQFDLS